MIDVETRIIAVASVVMLAACDANLPESPAAVKETAAAPVSMEGATCALVPDDDESAGWGYAYSLQACLRKLAYEDWPQASAEAGHIAEWSLGNGSLREMTASLTRYESSAALQADLESRGLLGGPGAENFLEYVEDGWQPVTVNDWLQKSGHWYGFDAETGMYPNYHDSLLYSLAELFGPSFEDAKFSETAPDMDSEDPYKLYATLGEKKWSREAANYGDWYDVTAVLQMLNDMAVESGIVERAIPLETYDQAVIVVVAPGEALMAAISDGLIYPAGANRSMERGKAFEDEVRKRYRVQ